MTLHFKGVCIYFAQGDLAAQDVDAIMVPANIHLNMDRGVAGRMASAGGPSVVKEAADLAPAEIGSAVITHAGELKARKLIHLILHEGNDPVGEDGFCQ